VKTFSLSSCSASLVNRVQKNSLQLHCVARRFSHEARGMNDRALPTRCRDTDVHTYTPPSVLISKLPLCVAVSGCEWLCMAVCGCVWLCVAVSGCEWLLCGCVWLCVAVSGCVWLCVAVCGCVWLCVSVCVCVCMCVWCLLCIWLSVRVRMF